MFCLNNEKDYVNKGKMSLIAQMKCRGRALIRIAKYMSYESNVILIKSLFVSKILYSIEVWGNISKTTNIVWKI